MLTLPSLTCMSPFPSFPFPPKLPPLPSLYPSLILLPSSSTHSPSPSSFFHRSSSLPNRGDHDSRVEASKMAIVAMLKSWPGVFCLCSPSNSGITSLFSMLPLAKPLVQVSTYHIGSNPDTSCRPCVYRFLLPFPFSSLSLLLTLPPPSPPSLSLIFSPSPYLPSLLFTLPPPPPSLLFTLPPPPPSLLFTLPPLPPSLLFTLPPPARDSRNSVLSVSAEGAQVD